MGFYSLGDTDFRPSGSQALSPLSDFPPLSCFCLLLSSGLCLHVSVSSSCVPGSLLSLAPPWRVSGRSVPTWMWATPAHRVCRGLPASVPPPRAPSTHTHPPPRARSCRYAPLSPQSSRLRVRCACGPARLLPSPSRPCPPLPGRLSSPLFSHRPLSLCLLGSRLPLYLLAPVMVSACLSAPP